MGNPRHIALLLAILGVVFSASTSQAQVTATTTVTLTVVPAPGISITPVMKQSEGSRFVTSGRSSEVPGITFKSSQNVMVQLNSANSVSSEFDLQEGQVKTFSARNLKNISKVEIIYLGS